MRITFVITRMGCGGAERMMSYLVNDMCGRGHDATLILLQPDPLFFPISPKVTLRVFDIMNPDKAGIVIKSWNFVKRLIRLRGTILASNPDLVVSFIEVSNALTLAAVAGTSIPVVISERSNPYLNPVPFPYGFLRRKLYPKASAVVIQTEQLRPWTHQWLDAERVKVIPNPVATAVSGTMNLADLFQHSEKVIVAMGRLDACKGFDLLIDAFSRVAPTRDNWALLILGDGEEREALARQVDDLGLSGKVLLPGEVANPAGVLRQCEIFVLSSRYEGFPNALCEAMGSGLPPISFDCKYGPSEIITDGENGILVPSGDVKALSEALMKLMDDPSLRERIRKNARGVSEKYGFSAIMDEWDALFARAGSR